MELTGDLPRAGSVEVLISWVLRIGVALSMILIASGVCLSFSHHPEYFSDPASLGEALDPSSASCSIDDATQRAASGSGRALVTLGLLVLLATPMVRVALSLLVFIGQRDWAFVTITSLVLGLLGVSLALGRVGH